LFLKKFNKKGALRYPTRKGKIGAPKKEGEATTKMSADAHIILPFVVWCAWTIYT
jgi:hypothetical protein